MMVVVDRELDALVAEKIMGLIPQKDFGKWDEHDWIRNKYGEIDTLAYDSDVHNGPRCRRCGDVYCIHCEDNDKQIPCEVEPRPYSSDIGWAWRVVENMNARNNDEQYQGYFRFSYEWNELFLSYRIASKAARAICFAALRAVGVEIWDAKENEDA